MTKDRNELFTFEDIEEYDYVRYKGQQGYVLDKGEHLVPDVDASHIHIQLDTGAAVNVHEDLVTRRLAENSAELWCDFNNHVTRNIDYATNAND